MTERLMVINVQLAFAMSEDEDEEDVFDTANMALIPLQRREGSDSGLIDYKLFDPVVVSPTPVEGYDYDMGFE